LELNLEQRMLVLDAHGAAALQDDRTAFCEPRVCVFASSQPPRVFANEATVAPSPFFGSRSLCSTKSVSPFPNQPSHEFGIGGDVCECHAAQRWHALSAFVRLLGHVASLRTAADALEVGQTAGHD
jgi:hypothetical protein